MYGFGYNMFWDSTYILLVIGMIICVVASGNVSSTFAKYSKVASRRGMTAAQVAEFILRRSGISHVRVERVAGDLTDHYDPRTRVVNLSSSVYDSTSVAAIGVAAHECGHAIQHAKAYAPLMLRHAIIPVCNICSRVAPVMFLLGYLASIFLGLNNSFAQWGILLFSATLVVQIVTLPVEFNASRRAVAILRDTNTLERDELRHTKKVLTAAALTYVAAVVSTLLQLLRLVLIFGGRRND